MTGAPAASGRAVVWPLLAGVAVLAGCTAAGIGALSLAAALTATGLPDPGPVTTLGLPFVRAAGEVAAVVAVGRFCWPRFWFRRSSSGVLDVDGYRAVRVGTVAAGAWAVCAALLVPLTISDVSGQPITAHLNPAKMWSLAGLINISTAWRWTALLAAVVMLASLPVLRWSWTPLLLVGSLVTLIPLGLTGHSSAGGSHDLATNSLLIHLVAASLWAGGLLALLAHVIRGGQHAGLAARRFSVDRVVVLCRDGAQRRRQRAGADPAVGPAHHRLRAAGARQVRRAVPARRRSAGVSGAPESLRCKQIRARVAALIRLALIEALLFGAHLRHRRRPGPHTAAAAADRHPVDSRREDRLRLRRAAHPGAGALRLAFRPDLRHGRHRLRRAVSGRSAAATAARRRLATGPDRGLAAGCLALLFVTSSGVGRYMPAMFSMHMAAHMLLSMLVPDPAGVGGPGRPGVAGAAGRRPRRPARYAGMAAGRPAQQAVEVPHQSGGCHGVVRRRVLRALSGRPFRRRSRQPRRAMSR